MADCNEGEVSIDGECCDEDDVIAGECCDDQVDRGGEVIVAPGAREIAPNEGRRLLMALLDSRHWPMHVCGDTNTGAIDWDQAVDSPCGHANEVITAIDDGPATDGTVGGFTEENPNYPFPGVGITAHACQLGCSYQIVGDLGADVIVGKIDGQWNILKILCNATTQSVTEISNVCRCCGILSAGTKFEAIIKSIDPPGCGPYDVCQRFELDPASCVGNPLNITVACSPEPESEFSDIDDWEVRVCGVVAENLALDCCANPNADVCDEPGSGSGSGSGSGECQFALSVQTGALASCDGCDYEILIRTIVPNDDPCAAPDEDIEEVQAEACGLPDLDEGTRVILVKIPGGKTALFGSGSGCDAGSGSGLVEWFVIRACDLDADCENPCEPPEVPSLCCDKQCEEHPAAVTATIETDGTVCSCHDGLVLANTGRGSPCDLSADVRWALDVPEFPGFIEKCENECPESGTGFAVFKFTDAVLICGSSANLCAGSGSGAAPSFSLRVNAVDGVLNEDTACCDPLFLEFDFPSPQFPNFCESESAECDIGSPGPTYKITITE